MLGNEGRVTRDCKQWSIKELGDGHGGTEGEVKVCNYPTCFPGLNGPLVLWKYLPELASFRIKSWGKKYLFGPLNMGEEGRRPSCTLLQS